MLAAAAVGLCLGLGFRLGTALEDPGREGDRQMALPRARTAETTVEDHP